MALAGVTGEAGDSLRFEPCSLPASRQDTHDFCAWHHGVLVEANAAENTPATAGTRDAMSTGTGMKTSCGTTGTGAGAGSTTGAGNVGGGGLGDAGGGGLGKSTGCGGGGACAFDGRGSPHITRGMVCHEREAYMTCTAQAVPCCIRTLSLY